MNNLAHDTHTPWWTPLGLQPVRDGGPLNPVMRELVTWLIHQGYATTTMHNIIRAAGRVGDWMTRDKLTLDDLTTETLPTLVTRDNHSYPAHRVANESTSAVHRFLLATGRLAAPTRATPTASSRSAHGYLDDWCATLADAGYGRSWLHKARVWVTPFLRSVEDDAGSVNWRSIDARLVNDYVLDFSTRCSTSSTQCVAALLRSLLRWAADQGHTATDISQIVLSVRRQSSRMPDPIDDDQIARLKDSIDPSTLLGARDLAIIVMLSRLGLRIGEMAGLTLDDVSWRTSSLQVTGKNGRRLTLPVPVDVGEALVSYLTVRHAEDGERHVFVRALAPLTAISPAAIGTVVSTRARQAGLDGIHAHRLRHTAAAMILFGGGDLEEVRQLLGHAGQATSLSYARLDHQRLHPLVCEWGTLP